MELRINNKVQSPASRGKTRNLQFVICDLSIGNLRAWNLMCVGTGYWKFEDQEQKNQWSR
jgi:hypothetical protein